LLLQIPLGKVLKLTLGELKVGGGRNNKFGFITRDGDVAVGEVSGFTIYLDAILKVLLEGGHVEDFILYGGSAVEYEFYVGLLGFYLILRKSRVGMDNCLETKLCEIEKEN
jgi:hypothetical protein